MKLQTTKYIDLGKALGQALTRTPEDAAVEIPPLLRPVIEFPGLLKSLAAANGPFQDSFFLNANLTQGSGGGGGTIQTNTLGAGVWHIRGHLTFSLSAAAAAFNKGVTLQIADPAGGAQTLLVVGSLVVPFTPVIIPVDYVFSFGVDGFRLQVVNGAIAVGDASESRFAAYAAKLI